MRRVLVIDDHIPSRKDLTKALAIGGFTVVGEGANGKSAATLAAANAAEVILMAVGLPDIDGILAARLTMQTHPCPIILLTSHYDAKTIQRAKNSGVMGLLIKPLRECELAPAIELAISRFEQFASLREENESLRKTLEVRKVIERAKGVLMKQAGLSEADAFSRIQKNSMDLRKPMVEIAQAILLGEKVTKRTKS
jgi:AmiR/NasT family two-component response regulator